MLKEFKGIYPYIVSPIDENGEVMTEVLTDLVNHLIDSGVHGIAPLGSTGEFFYLTWDQKKKIVETVVKAANHRVPVLAGVSASTVREAVEQAREFKEMGVDGLIGILTVYFPLSQESIYNYYKGLAESVDLPICLYNNPHFSGFELKNETLVRLSKIENIKYYKDASSNTGRLFSVINEVKDDLKVFSASAHIPAFVMQLGGVGWMSGPACLIPKESVRLFELCEAKKWDEAMELQRKIWTFNDAFQKYNLAACVKAGLELQGFKVGKPIPPTAALSDQDIADIKKVLETVKEI